MRINLGCGTDYRPGWVNCDKVRRIKADVYFDIDHQPWPFEDNSVTEVWMHNVIEHIHDIPAFMDELWRVCQPGSIARIGTAYGKSDGAIRDLTHCRLFTERSMDDYCRGDEWYSARTWILVEARLGVANHTILHRIRNLVPFRRLLRYALWNMYDNVDFVLKKPTS